MKVINSFLILREVAMSEKLSHEEFIRKAIISLRKGIGESILSIQDLMQHLKNILMEKTLLR